MATDTRVRAAEAFWRDTESEDIQIQHAEALNALAQKNPEMKVDLSGHTDWIGTEGYNQALSERRADSVKQYLIRKGVDAGRITTHAYGETRPIAPNDTAEGRAKNRRVEIRTDAQKK